MSTPRCSATVGNGSGRAAEDRISVLKGRKRVAEAALKPLWVKKTRSEIVPGEPLSPARLRRLAELSRTTGDKCDGLSAGNVCGNTLHTTKSRCVTSARHVKSYASFSRRRPRARRFPDPLLETLEADRLKELEKSVKQFVNELREAHGTVRKLRGSITGKNPYRDDTRFRTGLWNASHSRSFAGR